MKTDINQIDFMDELKPVAPGGRIGIIALATDLTIEQELRTMMPPEVEVFTNRVKNSNPLTLENLRAMQGDIGRAADGLLPGEGVDAVIYGCTSGAAAMGNEVIATEIRKSQNAPFTTPLLALEAACEALGVRKLSILTPYISEINHELVKCLTAAGQTVVNVNGLGFTDDCVASGISVESICRYAKQTFCEPAEALFISCTALRAASVIDKIELEVGVPVMSSNQILAWHALRLLGYQKPIDGFGKLLRLSL
ncbi:MAG: Asp/Glu racemase [Gammaproteobacteria bacterium WSBS_2016_MAG_OTU1]